MFGTPSQEQLDRLEARREALRTRCESFLTEKRAAGVEELSDPDATKLRGMLADHAEATERAEHYRHELGRVGSYPASLGSSTGALAYGHQWAEQVAEKLHRSMGGGLERRVVVSGSLDIPQLVEVDVIPIARPLRLIDLFPNRAQLSSNSFEYYVQSVRDIKATAVADNTLKPTSTLTVTPHEDRARVIGHLSEAAPVRLWYDHESFVAWLQSEMVGGVLDALEAQIVAGDGVGENMVGLLSTPGTTQVPFTIDAPTTLRSAVTALQVLGEVPNGWCLNPVDAQDIDLLRWGASGGLLTEGYATGVAPGNDPSSNNIFGTDVKRVVSNSVPAGTAILGDFSKLRVYVREDAHMDVDASGPLFERNQFIARGEGRFGIGVLRPSSFAICDLTATTTRSKSAAK